LAAQPRRVLLERRARILGRLLGTADLRARLAEFGLGRRDDFCEKAWQRLRRIELELVPQPLWAVAEAGSLLEQDARPCLESLGHGVESFGEWPYRAGEEQEYSVADVVSRADLALPGAVDLVVE
jgi:hypothetical protein